MPNSLTSWGPNFTVSPSTIWNRGLADRTTVSLSVSAVAGEATMRASRTRTHIAGSRRLNRWPERDLRCFLVTVGLGGGAGPVTPRNSRTDSSLIPTPIMAAKAVSDMRPISLE